MKFLEIKLEATIAIAKLTRLPIIQWKRKRDFWFKYQSSSWFYDWVPCHTTVLSNLKLDQLMYDVGVISTVIRFISWTKWIYSPLPEYRIFLYNIKPYSYLKLWEVEPSGLVGSDFQDSAERYMKLNSVNEVSNFSILNS